MGSARFELALDRLNSSDWQLFETLASEFLATEFDSLRTLASPSGDEGRDAILYSPSGKENIVLQYSVTKDWKGKIDKTIKRVKQTNPNLLCLIYVTNHQIGSKADTLKRDILLNHSVTIDLRDKTWFLERESGNIESAERISRAIVDPILAQKGISVNADVHLSHSECIAVAIFLELQWQDESRGKGLTKLIFQAIVKAALADTDSNNRIKREKLHSRIFEMLPNHDRKQVQRYIDSAINKLKKDSIKHWPKDDEFCLSHEEIQKASEASAASISLDERFDLLVKEFIVSIDGNSNIDNIFLETIAQTSKEVISNFIAQKSQEYAQMIHCNEMIRYDQEDFRSLTLEAIAQNGLTKKTGIDTIKTINETVHGILSSRDHHVAKYLRKKIDTNTLLAFLKLTPDVQSSINKLFSYGSIWLDTNIVLPIMAETLNDGPYPDRYTAILAATKESGLKLYITEGVLEEIERHIYRCRLFTRTLRGEWEGDVPYLVHRFVESGNSISAFNSWSEIFCGDTRPSDDIQEYLLEEFGIEVKDLRDEAEKIDPDLKYEISEWWREVHEIRRSRRIRQDIDEMTLQRLISHDADCCCGVIHMRSKEKPSVLGYTAWWLTVDQKAFELWKHISQKLNKPIDSAVISVDFLTNYLAFGPRRGQLNKETESNLPIFVADMAGYLTPELIEETEKIHAQLKGKPERLIKRTIRDKLDKMKRKIGPQSNEGTEYYRNED